MPLNPSGIRSTVIETSILPPERNTFKFSTISASITSRLVPDAYEIERRFAEGTLPSVACTMAAVILGDVKGSTGAFNEAVEEEEGKVVVLTVIRSFLISCRGVMRYGHAARRVKRPASGTSAYTRTTPRGTSSSLLSTAHVSWKSVLRPRRLFRPGAMKLGQSESLLEARQRRQLSRPL